MPSLFARTFAVLNATKPPALPDSAPLPSVDVTVPMFDDSNSENSTSEDSYKDRDRSQTYDLRCVTDPHHLSTPELVETSPEPSISIFKAAEEGDTASLSYFIEHYNNNVKTLVNQRDPDTDSTLLQLVVSHVRNPLDCLRILLSQGADLSARNIYNVQAIHMLLLNCKSPFAPLKLMLEYNADAASKDGDGWTPLHYCTRFCEPSIPLLKLLIDNGGQINAEDASSKTPVFGLMAHGDHVEILEWLIHTGKPCLSIKGEFFNSKTRSSTYGTLLMQAAKYGRLQSLNYLLNTSTTMQMLRPLLTYSEIKHCIGCVQEVIHQQDYATTEGLATDLLQTLHTILSSLECDPDSMIYLNELKNPAQRRESKSKFHRKAFIKRMTHMFRSKSQEE
ncbi:ankyrin repeat-containing domain protein [Spinellus fusiger]|nr:ankyrin repeat-containing domain protein [Spinellus fusiger]